MHAKEKGRISGGGYVRIVGRGEVESPLASIARVRAQMGKMGQIWKIHSFGKQGDPGKKREAGDERGVHLP